jgi:hypothetical protein
MDFRDPYLGLSPRNRRAVTAVFTTLWVAWGIGCLLVVLWKAPVQLLLFCLVMYGLYKFWYRRVG